MVQNDPGNFDPGGMIGVEFDFAMAVDAEEGLEMRGEFAEGREVLLLDEIAGRIIAEELEETGSATNFLGEGVEFSVDHAGLGFTEGEEGVVEAGRVGGADGEK